MRGTIFATLIFACYLIASAFLAVAAVILLASCAHAPPAPAGMITGPDMPARLYCVTHDDEGRCLIYRSAQPTKAQFQAMRAQLKLASVIKLNSAIEGRDEVPDGVALNEDPWLPAGPVDHDDIEGALNDLETAPRPTLIHCEHGVDRTGLLVALWRVKHEHSLPAAAWGEWLAYGRDTLLIALSSAFERETGWSPDQDTP